MRRYRMGWVSLFAAAALEAALYGCSAGANAPIDDVDATTPAGDDASVVDDDATSPDLPGASPDAGHATPKDAGPDVRFKPDTGAPGTPCGPVGQNESQTCGLCGNQTRVCLPGDGGVDGGQHPGLWSDWGACTGEATGPGVCDPSATDAGTVACGNCGHRPVVCQADCHIAQGIVCQGEPANACTPNETQFTLAQGCAANLGRAQTCGNDCTWGPPSACEAPPPNPNAVTASKTSGTTVSGTFSLASAKKMPALDTGTCPTTVGSESTPYVFVEVHNPDTKAHVVDVWTSKVTVVQDNIIAWYNTPVVPTNDTDRGACSGQVNDGCSTTRTLTPACTGTNFAGLVDGDAPTIPAGGAIEVYVAGFSGATPAGSFELNVRTR